MGESISLSARRFEELFCGRSPHPKTESALRRAASAARAGPAPAHSWRPGSDPDRAELQARRDPGASAVRRDEIERWREAVGRLILTALAIAKGPRRLEAKGEFALDDSVLPNRPRRRRGGGARRSPRDHHRHSPAGRGGGVLGSLL